MFSFVAQLQELRRTTSLSKKEQAEKMAQIVLPSWLAFLSKHSVTALVFTIWGVSSAICLKFFSYVNNESGPLQYVGFALIPFLFITLFIVIGGLVSQIGKPGVIEGKFPRKHDHPIYALRRIYGPAWTQVYYFKPLYAVCLSVPFLKKILFRMYGYTGDLSFTVYPDSWIRDLPLLKLGKDVYLANRCVVGTNLCLNDGTILVGKCTFDDGSMVGHLGIFGLGTYLGKKSEIGVGASTGIRVSTGEHVQIAPKAVVYHAVTLGNRVKIQGCAVIGMQSKIADGIEIKAGCVIRPGTNVQTQEQADKIHETNLTHLLDQKEALFETLREQISNGKSA